MDVTKVPIEVKFSLIDLIIFAALSFVDHLEMWLWRQNIVCNLKVLDDRDHSLFNVLCVINQNDDEFHECTHFLAGHMHDDDLVIEAGDSA